MLLKHINKKAVLKTLYTFFICFICFVIITSLFSSNNISVNENYEKILFFKMPVGGNVKILSLVPHSLKGGDNLKITAWISYEHLFYGDRLSIDIYKRFLIILTQLTAALYMMYSVSKNKIKNIYHMLNWYKFTLTLNIIFKEEY